MTQRLSALLEDLLGVVPEDREPALERHKTLLHETVEQRVMITARRKTAPEADARGTG